MAFRGALVLGLLKREEPLLVRMKPKWGKSELKIFRKSKTSISRFRSLHPATPEGTMLQDQYSFFGETQKLGLCHLQPDSWNHDRSETGQRSQMQQPVPQDVWPGLLSPCMAIYPPHTSCYPLLSEAAMHFRQEWLVPPHPVTQTFRVEMWPYHLTAVGSFSVFRGLTQPSRAGCISVSHILWSLTFEAHLLLAH